MTSLSPLILFKGPINNRISPSLDQVNSPPKRLEFFKNNICPSTYSLSSFNSDSTTTRTQSPLSSRSTTKNHSFCSNSHQDLNIFDSIAKKHLEKLSEEEKNSLVPIGFLNKETNIPPESELSLEDLKREKTVSGKLLARVIQEYSKIGSTQSLNFLIRKKSDRKLYVVKYRRINLLSSGGKTFHKITLEVPDESKWESAEEYLLKHNSRSAQYVTVISKVDNCFQKHTHVCSGGHPFLAAKASLFLQAGNETEALDLLMQDQQMASLGNRLNPNSFLESSLALLSAGEICLSTPKSDLTPLKVKLHPAGRYSSLSIAKEALMKISKKRFRSSRVKAKQTILHTDISNPSSTIKFSPSSGRYWDKVGPGSRPLELSPQEWRRGESAYPNQYLVRNTDAILTKDGQPIPLQGWQEKYLFDIRQNPILDQNGFAIPIEKPKKPSPLFKILREKGSGITFRHKKESEKKAGFACSVQIFLSRTSRT
ncbi:MAG: hypothetical protein ACI9YB_000825 [Halioglobus sp.]